MALGFRKKKGGSEDTAEEQVSAPAATRQRKRKPNERLSSVVKESAPGAAVDVLARNTEFVLPNEAGWFALLLNVEAPEFGGLSVKHKGDEAKGSIIELITADEIEVVATPEMLAEDILGIVPTASTLERMGEYSLLTRAPYVWAVVSRDENDQLMVRPVAEASYAEALDVSSGRRTLAQLNPEVWAWAGGDAVEEQQPFSASEDAGDEQWAEQDQWTDESEQPFASEDASDDEEFDSGPATELYDPEDEGAVDYGALDDGGGGGIDYGDDDEGDYGAEDYDETDALADMVDEDEDAGEYEDYVAANYEREVPLAEVRQTLARRLSPEDLNLEVDTQEFDRSFSIEAPVIEIETGDHNAWLADQVADLTRQANANIAKMRADHVAELRRRYVALMSEHSEKVTRDLSTSRPGTQYFELMKAASADFEDDKRKGGEVASERRNEITRRFEEEAEEAGRAAAAAAKARFLAQNRSLRERLISEAALVVETGNEERYAHKREMLLQMRRDDARLAMELGSTKAMQLLGERQEQQQKAESELLREWSERIAKFIDDNRKHDVARAETLAAQLSRENHVAELNAQFATERERLTGEYATRIRELEAAIIANRDQALAELRERESEWEHRVKVGHAEVDSARTLVAKMEAQMGELRKTYEEQYEGRIATLVSDKESYATELERANHIQSRANKVLVVLVIVLAVAAFAVGIIVGWAWFNASLADAMALPWADGVGALLGGATP